MSEQQSDQTATAAERRRADRHTCDLPPLRAAFDGDPTTATEALVHNISTTGLCLQTPVRVRPGTVLVLQLFEAAGVARPLPVRVIHTAQQTDGSWLSGGAFVRRLSEQELESILAAGRPAVHRSSP